MTALRCIAAVAVGLAAMIAMTAPVGGQEPPEYVEPPCFSPTGCVALDMELLLRLQREGGDSDALSLLEVRSFFNLPPPPSPNESGVIPFVVGGTPVPPLFDEVVRIRFDVGGATPALCTGVALGPNAVLTAGHCGCAAEGSYRIAFPKPSDTFLQDYFYDERRLSQPPLPYFGFDCRYPQRPQPGRDLALLFLAPANTGFNLVPPPVMPLFQPYGQAREDRLRNLLVLGYGRREDGAFPRQLIGASVPVVDFFCLVLRSNPSGCSVFREFVLSSLVSESDAEADTCDGDSGGPVYFIGETARPDGRLELHRHLVGITSRGLGGVPQFGGTGCGGGGIYTAVAHPDVMSWLAVNGVSLDHGATARRFAETVVAAPPQVDFPFPIPFEGFNFEN